MGGLINLPSVPVWLAGVDKSGSVGSLSKFKEIILMEEKHESYQKTFIRAFVNHYDYDKHERMLRYLCCACCS